MEKMSEHLKSLKKSLEEPSNKNMESVGPLLKHHGTYHIGSLPKYWGKAMSKHYTAFSRQIREGVKVS